ncbi:MAG: hypothetical protein B7Y40_01340 [Gammaproteobacteria bacterium 28-57-27]|nr:MAG: hypothetical protein B7Y40_01340 [Gammaproteobacteria bacterium 28-57-27]
MMRRFMRMHPKLIQATQCEPFAGIGKTEALKHALAGL